MTLRDGSGWLKTLTFRTYEFERPLQYQFHHLLFSQIYPVRLHIHHSLAGISPLSRAPQRFEKHGLGFCHPSRSTWSVFLHHLQPIRHRRASVDDQPRNGLAVPHPRKSDPEDRICPWTTFDNHSAYMIDSALWTVYLESRERMKWRFYIQQAKRRNDLVRNTAVTGVVASKADRRQMLTVCPKMDLFRLKPFNPDTIDFELVQIFQRLQIHGSEAV
ncbi:hypothetical protein B0H67DRAFT_200545 [Lasiosphaeris hirsuta]|uniref:Uncharacterized protein n=1 Tax=Lasiosphaeris hirsuta TaxID=260670 RepID=A0AA40ARP0_9PEZI|nr:hypothetical protein B0H67DRAFT_200545 [Lasiosphaeris hirsuta]